MPPELSFAERRVLGVLIEKGFTTRDQYPLTLNGVVVGSNQKSCRDPACNLDEQVVFESLDSLRQKGFTVLVRMEGSRVDRWKHRTGECLNLEAEEVALLAELLLRGPQTEGELRQRASRMVEVAGQGEVERILETLRSREDPLVERLGPPGKRRGVKYAHTLYPTSERPDASAREVDSVRGDLPPPPEVSARPQPSRVAPAAAPVSSAVISVLETEEEGSRPGEASVSADVLSELNRRLKALEERVEELEATFVKFLR
jgi:uncharacterized protein YceH (UPF0502 family)